ncbi:class I SAM-dependent methyltransferase [Catelliglobosispora koreensis]|uniref:class I SAM-dependent methyltransferase n=1 Tax=Catelliglobosispora koreensis TaxID=129052 RepID=UPI00037B7692|nr:methyltransferase domain-containing protein [Catelliglobosispora koreensis]
MADDSAALAWNWEDPEGLTALVDTFTVDLAKCEKLELVAEAPLFTREVLQGIGVTGIEFAQFKTDHPAGLASDIVGLHNGETATKRGGIYRVDGAALFTELDISEPLPIEDGAVDWVYAEHLIEHVSLTAGVAWLKEVRRILAPGGTVRITTPDLKVYAQSYVNGDGFFGKHRRRMNMALSAIAPPMPARGAFMFNQLFYVYGHKWIYDENELRYVLGEAGFADDAVQVHAYRKGARQDVADLDQVLRNDESIYIEATA